ncbi:universal stress protein UspE [Candidatus Thalassolituus haligoni]|uniref:universal stress protein UspE n=1 Tax=Candidatus Thalassolituus haligoni TaxID=3100113 RepID=UPI0035120198
MLDINHLLVVLDAEHPEQIALDKALWLAGVLKADVSLLTSVYEPYCGDSSSLEETTKQQIRRARIDSTERWIESFVPEVQERGITVRTEVHWQKHLHEAVIESMRATDYDLVIKGTHPHSLIDRLFTHTDWNLMRHCPAPVLLVKSPAAWQHNRILAAIDATSVDDGHQLISDNILSFAEHLADHFDTDLHMVNAFPQVAIAFAMVPEVTAPDDIQAYITEQHQDACEQLAKKYNIHEDHVHIAEGETDTVVAETATAVAADVLVVGSVGRSGIAGVLIGNTAEQLVDKVPCDVIVIKPQDGVLPEAE